MTTNASKFGLRKAAAERSNRHAQRTALPPKAGVVQAARDAISATKPTESAGERPNAASHTKATRFAELAATARWDVSTAERGDTLELTATRGPEVIVQAWRNGVWQYESSVYAFADRTTKPRNASGASKLLDRSPADAEKETAKVNANQAFRRREPKSLQTIVLPLDPELLTNEEAAKYFRGRTIRWYNRISRNAETAMVSRSSEVHVTRHDGEVTIWFCCPVSGFRAFHLSAVLAVGRGKASEETADVELVEEDAA